MPAALRTPLPRLSQPSKSRARVVLSSPGLHRCSSHRTSPTWPRQQQLCSTASKDAAAAATITLEPPAPTGEAAGQAPRLRVVVLGTGWGAVSFLRNIDPMAFREGGAYDLTVVSPRNYFLFTPLLPSAMTGTVEERSLVAPIRDVIQGKGLYYEATCVDIDPHARVLTCKYEREQGHGKAAEEDLLEVPYDVLVLAVGAVSSSFGVEGVTKHCWFMKSMEDAKKLRAHIGRCIEAASLPTLSPEARCKLLKFVVVGGGPTGVEVAAELHDLIAEDIPRFFPHIAKDDVSITLVDGHSMVLSSFHEEVGQYAGKLLSREGVHFKLNTHVEGVHDGMVRLKYKDGSTEELEFGTCIWATGIGTHPLVATLREKLGAAAQGNRRGLVVDSYLRVRGTGGSIIALGDAAITDQARSLEQAEVLFQKGDADADGKLSRRELLATLLQSKAEFPQLSDLAVQLDWGLGGWLGRLLFPNSAAESIVAKYRAEIDRGVDLEAFKGLLADADAATCPLPPTAQVARQEGEYLASLFSQELVLRTQPTMQEESVSGPTAPVQLASEAQPFMYIHLGSLAYLGINRAVMQLPNSVLPITSLKGWVAAHLWRTLELYMQVSARNSWMVSSDWLRVKFFGRNMAEL